MTWIFLFGVLRAFMVGSEGDLRGWFIWIPWDTLGMIVDEIG
jgi:hypothetical protein